MLQFLAELCRLVSFHTFIRENFPSLITFSNVRMQCLWSRPAREPINNFSLIHKIDDVAYWDCSPSVASNLIELLRYAAHRSNWPKSAKKVGLVFFFSGCVPYDGVLLCRWYVPGCTLIFHLGDGLLSTTATHELRAISSGVLTCEPRYDTIRYEMLF